MNKELERWQEAIIEEDGEERVPAAPRFAARIAGTLATCAGAAILGAILAAVICTLWLGDVPTREQLQRELEPRNPYDGGAHEKH